MSQAKPGDQLPDVVLYEIDNEVKLRDLFAGKKGVLFGVPGAFTPTCSATHLPSYVASLDKLKAAGCDTIVCVSCNDPWVMDAWAKSAGADGKIQCLSDKHGMLTKALGMESSAVSEYLGGGVRSQRFSIVVHDNVIKNVNVDEPSQATCTLADPAIRQLQNA